MLHPILQTRLCCLLLLCLLLLPPCCLLLLLLAARLLPCCAAALARCRRAGPLLLLLLAVGSLVGLRLDHLSSGVPCQLLRTGGSLGHLLAQRGGGLAWEGAGREGWVLKTKVGW